MIFLSLKTEPGETRSRLARRLGTADAVVIGLGSMIGAGVFAALGPAAKAAGAGLLIGLALAAFVAYCNATSSAALAALYPESGGAYVYGRKRLSPFWGFLAGWCFVIGKLASCAAMALTFGAYAAPPWRRPLALGAVVILTGVNLLGIKKTARVTWILVTVVLASLAVVVAAVLLGGRADPSNLRPLLEAGPYGILQSAGFLFFAFAGYARLATLGEEVRDPEHTIPRAIPLAFGVALLVYAAVALSALLGAGPKALAESPAPLATAVAAGTWSKLAPIVRVGAAVACLSALISLLAGLSRTVFAMSSHRDLPHFLATVHPRLRIPHRAEAAVGLTVMIVVSWIDVPSALGFSSFAVLLYYAVANLSAASLRPSERHWPKWLAWAGLLGCVLLAFSLPLSSVLGGSVLTAGGFIFWILKRSVKTAARGG